MIPGRWYPSKHCMPVNWSSIYGFPDDPYWGFAEIMTLERGPPRYCGKEADDLIDEINMMVSCQD